MSKAEKLIETLQSDIESGDINKTWERINTSHKLEIGQGCGVDVLQDQSAIQQAFAAKQEPLVVYPGALNNLFKDALERDAFIAFQGGEKKGKTFLLLDLAWRAMCQRRKVAFFEVGDLSQNQIMRRFMIRAAGRPLKSCTVKYPKSISHHPDSEIAEVEETERVYKNPLSWGKAWKACQEVMISKTKSKDSYLRLSCHPNSSISIQGVYGILQGWERDGWTPDCIIIDYADILAPIRGDMETRDAINSTWKQMRALSQSLHCLVATATQAKATSYKAHTQTREHFSENKLKMAHVTGMIGINQSEDEKDIGVIRLNWIVLREGEFSEGKCVHCAGALALAAPLIRSTF